MSSSDSAALGFRCSAPNLRRYGRSSTYTRHEGFAELIVQDMLWKAEYRGLQSRKRWLPSRAPLERKIR